MVIDKKYIGLTIRARAHQEYPETAIITGIAGDLEYEVTVLRGTYKGKNRRWFAPACELCPGVKEPQEYGPRVKLKRKAVW